QPSFWETVAMDKQNWVFSVDNVVKHSGNTSASIEGKGNWAYWMQHFEGDAIPAGREVTVSGYVKTEDVDQRAEIWIYCVDSDGNPTETVTAPISGTKDWTFVTASQRIPEDAVRMDIDLFIWGPGKVWFDDIQLVTEGKWAQKPVAEKPDAALAKAYGSYIVSQKEPEPSGWFKAMIPAEGLVMSWKDSTSHTGKRCVSISNKHLYDEPVYNNWAQNIEFAHKEKKIELSGWIKTENVTGGGASLIVQCIGENYTLLADRSTKGVDGTTNWTLYNASITVPAETTNLTVRAVLVGTGKVWFDDVQLRATETHGGFTSLLKNSGFEEGEGTISFSPPINYESQALLGFWMESEPSGYIKEWRFEKDVGPNYIVEVGLKQIPTGEEVKVNWYAYVFTKAFDYSTLPENAPISDLKDAPEDVKRWLEPTEAVQSDHPEIVAKAKELRGDSDDIMEIARQITNFVGKEIGDRGGMQDALTTLRTGGAVCTGHANLAAALSRANGIPCRVLAVSSSNQLQTHYVVEFYVPDYGWVWMESTMGIMPYQPTDAVLLRIVYPEDEILGGVPKNTTIDSTPNVNVGHGLSESCYQGREILHRYWGDEEEIAAAYSRTEELGDRSIRGLEMDLQAIRFVEECSTIEEYIAFLDLYSSGK
ncbi:MAG: transglutaminase-like domain-containing protein, partial [Candidatus Thermoplasmatota archaeon]|nr:transglutaminase-like domain-containing protein [Candidatus Thermoplasmatota archaeon]